MTDMRLLFVSCVAIFGLGACADHATPPVAPTNADTAGQWAPPAPPTSDGPLPGINASQTNPPVAPPPWGGLFPSPQVAPQPGSPQAPPPAFPFGVPAGLPAPALPTAWPVPPQMPAGFPAVPGLPALWPQAGPPAPPAPTQPVPGSPGATPGATSDVAQRCVNDINGYRATKGLAPLARWTAGEPCATQEAADDSRTQRPHGSFGACKESSQNACPNWTGPAERMTDDCLRMMWNEGPGDFPAHGHYNNMVDTRVTSVACGIFTMSDGRLWAVQDFR